MVSDPVPRAIGRRTPCRNIRQTRCFAVHVVDDRLARAMNITAQPITHPATNEFEALGLISSPAAGSGPRVVAGCPPPALESELPRADPRALATIYVHHGVGPRWSWCTCRSGCLGPARGTASTEALRPVGKLALNDYTRLGRCSSWCRPAGAVMTKPPVTRPPGFEQFDCGGGAADRWRLGQLTSGTLPLGHGH